MLGICRKVNISYNLLAIVLLKPDSFILPRGLIFRSPRGIDRGRGLAISREHVLGNFDGLFSTVIATLLLTRFTVCICAQSYYSDLYYCVST